MNDQDLDERLREAFDARAASTTVTELPWDERVATSELQIDGRSHFRPFLVAAALVAVVAGGVAFAFGAAGDDPDVVIVTNPTTVTTKPEPVTQDNPRIAPPVRMQLGPSTEYYLPESPANGVASIDAARTSVACEHWHVASDDVVCDTLVGRVVVSMGESADVQTLYGIADTDDGYTVSLPINDAAPYRVGGRPALVSNDGSGRVQVAFEIDARTRVVVDGRGTIDEVLQVAESVHPTPLDRQTVPLVAAEHQPLNNGLRYPTAWIAVGIDADARPCVALVPFPFLTRCRTITQTAIGGIADNMMVVGWARPGVTRVEVRVSGERSVDAAFLDTVELGGTRLFYADTLVDPFVRITAIGYDEAGKKVATVVIQEPCTTCE